MARGIYATSAREKGWVSNLSDAFALGWDSPQRRIGNQTENSQN
jgi:hypothetical protein